MTTLQTNRRHDPYPFTWEIPAGILTLWVLLAVIFAHVGRALANLLAGAGWTWPASRNLFTSLAGLISGDAAAGLTNKPTHLADHAAVGGWIVTTEVLLAGLLIITTVWALRRWGPGRMKGMASTTEAEAILGVSRLRRVARIIRPDLHAAAAAGHDGYHPGGPLSQPDTDNPSR